MAQQIHITGVARIQCRDDSGRFLPAEEVTVDYTVPDVTDADTSFYQREAADYVTGENPGCRGLSWLSFSAEPIDTAEQPPGQELHVRLRVWFWCDDPNIQGAQAEFPLEFADNFPDTYSVESIMDLALMWALDLIQQMESGHGPDWHEASACEFSRIEWLEPSGGPPLNKGI